MPLYYIKKEVNATSIPDAIKREKQGKITECWVKPEEYEELTPAIGFEIEPPYEYEEGKENRLEKTARNHRLCATRTTKRGR